MCTLSVSDAASEFSRIAEFTERMSLFLGRAALMYQFRVNSQMVLPPSGLPFFQKLDLVIFV